MSQKGKPINKEAFKMLAAEIGLNAAARKLGIPIPTAKSRAQRGHWNLPKRKRVGTRKVHPASLLHPEPVYAAQQATHEELEEQTKTGLMLALAKAAQKAGVHSDARSAV